MTRPGGREVTYFRTWRTPACSATLFDMALPLPTRPCSFERTVPSVVFDDGPERGSSSGVERFTGSIEPGEIAFFSLSRSSYDILLAGRLRLRVLAGTSSPHFAISSLISKDAQDFVLSGLLLFPPHIKGYAQDIPPIKPRSRLLDLSSTKIRACRGFFFSLHHATSLHTPLREQLLGS